MSSLTLVGSTLYGTTENGGAYGDGTIFSIHTDGTGYQVLYSFGATPTDGEDPVAGLTLDGSTLFGTTNTGGSAGGGTVFSINADGTGYQVVDSFTGDNQSNFRLDPRRFDLVWNYREWRRWPRQRLLHQCRRQQLPGAAFVRRAG